MPAPPPAEQFWLLTGEVPSGPFTVAQVHAELAAGRATWQTPACPVGGSTWLPLVQTPGIGPSVTLVVGPKPSEPPSPALPNAAPPAPAPSSGDPSRSGNLEGATAAFGTATTAGMAPASAVQPNRSSDVPPSAPPRNKTGTAPESPTHADAEWQKLSTELSKSEPGQSNQSNRFWLLVGTETTGPFRAAHIRAMLQSGELSADAKARRVGSEEWVPLTEAVGALPPCPPAKPKAPPTGSTTAAEKTASPPPAARPTPASGPPDQKRADGWLGWIGAALTILLAYGLLQGAGWVYEQVRPQKKSTALVPSVKTNPVTTTPPTAPPAGGTTAPAGTHGNWVLAGPPRVPPGLPDAAARLVGSWRWDGGGGFSSTYTFEANGAFTYYVTGANPLLNIPVSGCQAYGRWSVRDGTLFVEFTGANDPVLVPAFRGLTARSPVQFAGDSAVRLTGVEGDTATRTYSRVR